MSKHPMLQPLTTERFALTPLTRWGSFRLSYVWNDDPEIMRNMFYSPVPIKPFTWYRKKVWANGRNKFSHAITDVKGGKPIGMHLVRLVPHRSANLAVVVHDRAWWGKKVVEEVRSAVIDHLFENRVVDRICSEVSARNMPSVFNYRKLGFDHAGTLHKAKCDPTTGITSDVLIFELLREAWDARRSAS